MTHETPFQNLTLTMLPFDERTCVYNNEILLCDNFNDPIENCDLSANQQIHNFISSPYPFKLQFFLAIFCLDGYMCVRLNLNEYKIQRNCLQIIPSESIGQCLEISPDCRIAIIAFTNSYLISENNPQSALILRRFLIHNSLIELSSSEMHEIIDIYLLMRKKMSQPHGIFTREILDKYSQIIYYNICQLVAPYIERQNAEHTSRKKQIFDCFIELLKQHYTTERSIGFYANRLCLTPKYLSQVVRNFSGRHAGEWIRDYVILEAKALLKSGRYNIQQVSDMLNFANQSFFGVYFKKAVGCSPSAYQNS